MASALVRAQAETRALSHLNSSSTQEQQMDLGLARVNWGMILFRCENLIGIAGGIPDFGGIMCRPRQIQVEFAQRMTWICD